MAGPTNPKEPIPLTKRQSDVYTLYLCEMTYKEIAKELGITERTLQSHMTNIFHKGHPKRERERPINDTMRIVWLLKKIAYLDKNPKHLNMYTIEYVDNEIRRSR